MSKEASITYPPELLPIADEPAEVVVVDPVTGKQTIVAPARAKAGRGR